MRRMVGAAMVVLVLASPNLVSLVRDVVLAPVSTSGTPLSTAIRRAAPTASSTATVPDSVRAVPLAFLSRAPADSLVLLPGIGPVLASRIIAARHGRGSFTSWDDVLRVRGIGPRTLQRVQAFFAGR
jgi:competence protein ComEA